MKKALAALLAIAMVVTGFLCLYPNASEANAAATTTSEHGTFKAVPKAEWKEDNDGVPELDGYLFAGYYKNEDCAKANRASKGNATHAKFVSDDMLDVKVQVTNGKVSVSDVEAYEGKYVIRFVSSVESLNYKNIGFELEYTNDEGKVVTLRNTTSKVFTRIDSTTGAANGAVDEYQFSPKVVGEDSEYFMTAKLPVSEEDKEVTYKVKAFWTTFDGTEVMGKERCVSVNDSESNIVNMVADATASLTVGGFYTATYGSNADGTGADAANVEVLSCDADGHANIRVTLANGATATGLKSATKFIIKDASGNQVATAVYRNYYTDKAGTADTSWYDVDPTTTRFEIASISDLYGLASVVNTKGENFAGDEIRLVRSVTINKGSVVFSAQSASGVAEWKSDTTPVNWTPIGTSANPFAGTFDGDDNTISGLYLNTSESVAGMFGYTGANEVIKNFKLVDSYMKSTGDYLGLVGKAKNITIENVYTNACMTIDDRIGGFIGLLQTGSVVVTFNNCWFDGEVVSTAGALASGFVGFVDAKLEMRFNNCLSAGTVRCAAYRAGGFVGWLNYGWSGAADKWIFNNCLSVGNVSGGATYTGAYIGHVATNANSWTMNNSYGIGEKLVGKVDGGTAPANCLKTKDYLVNTDEAELFPTLSGESENAWVNDDGTPILASFAEWWKDRQYKASLDMSWYDEAKTEFELTTAAQLYGLAELAKTKSFEGKTIKLGADIALNKVDSAIAKKWARGTAVAENVWTPIGTASNPFAGTFDGQGYTISGLYLAGTTSDSGLFGVVAETSAIKDFKLVDSYMKTTTGDVGIVGYGKLVKAENIYTNAYMMSTGGYAGGLIGMITPVTQDTVVEINNCWFDGTVIGGYAAAGGLVGNCEARMTMKFNNCLNTGEVSCGYRTGGFVGWINNGWWTTKWETDKWIFNNCLSVGNVVSTGTDATWSKAGALVGCINTNAVSLTINHSYGVGNSIVGAYGSSTAADTKASFESATNLKTRDALIQADETTLFPLLEGETENAWVSDNAAGWNNTDRGTPILVTFAEWWTENVEHDELTVDFSWYNDNDTEFTLNDANDLSGLAYLVNNTSEQFAGKTIKLGADVQLNKVDDTVMASWKAVTSVPDNIWTPIGTSTKPFAGTFDGQGHTISGLYLKTADTNAGMFGNTGANATIKNFKLVDSYMKSTGTYLGLVGEAQNITIEDVYTNAYMTIDDRVGGFVGYLHTASSVATFNNCWFDGEAVSTAGALASGFVGLVDVTLEMEFNNCLSTGKVTSPYRAAGFVGWINSGWYVSGQGWQTNKWRFNNCLSACELSDSADFVGAAYVSTIGTNAISLAMNNSYGVGTKIVSVHGSDHTTEATKTALEANLKTRDYLIDTDETALFPVLEGETENAWVNDVGYNKVDRGTPILASFAEWWLARQPETELVERADTSWYDENQSEFILDSAAEFYGFAKLGQTHSFEGKTIKLGKDIALNKVSADTVEAWKDGIVPAGQWTPVGTSTVPFVGTFDGQGYTISGLYASTVDTAGMFAYTGTTAVLKNFKLVDSYLKTTAGNLGLVGTGKIALMENVYSNAYLESSASASTAGKADVAGFVGVLEAIDADTVTTFNNCWFDGEVLGKTTLTAGGFIGYIGSRITLECNNCLNTGTITSSNRSGGFIGWLNAGWWTTKWETDKWRFNNCLNAGEILGAAEKTGSYFGDIGTNAISFTMNNSYGVGTKIVGVHNSSHTTAATKTALEAILKERDELCGADASTLFTSDAWVNDNQNGWNDTDRGTPILVNFAEWWLARQPEPTYTVDMSWYNDSDDTFTLYDLADVRGFVAIANNKDNFAGKTVKLGADIVVNTPNVSAWEEGTKAEFEWTPIGTASKPFAGTFDGQGHTISGLYLNKTTSDPVGMFGSTTGTAIIKNFNLVDSYMKSTSGRIGIVGCGTVELIENVYTNAVIKSDSAFAVGGILGEFVPASSTTVGTFSNCWFDGVLTGGGDVAGGIVGNIQALSTLEFNDCLNTGSVSCNRRAGGIVGYINNGWWVTGKGWQTDKWVFNNCLNVGQVQTTGTDDYSVAGGIAGSVNTNAISMTLNNTYSIGTATCGYYYTSTETATKAKLESDAVLISRQDIINAGTFVLFPTSTAWVDDIGYNNTDRGTPILKFFADEWFERNPASGLTTRPDNSWYSDEESEFTFTTADQLYSFAQVAKFRTFEGKTVKLGADIVLNEVDETILAKWQGGSASGKNWTPIGTVGKPFAGTFDGQGHTISGLFLSTTASETGLFGTTGATAEIKDFSLVDSYIESTNNVVGLIGTGTFAKLEKVYTNAIMHVQGNNVGGFIGLAYGSGADMCISNCWFDGEIKQTWDVDSSQGTQGSIGGFVGKTAEATGGLRPKFVVSDCLNSGTVSGYNRVGGFIGWHAYGDKTEGVFSTWDNCLMVGSLTSENTSAMFVADYNTSGKTTFTASYATEGTLIQGAQAGNATYNEDVLMSRSELYLADVKTLFPESTAWVADKGYNDTNRGTPILAYFEAWWLARQSEVDASYAPSTAWYTAPEVDGEYVIQNKGDLLGFLSLAKKGETFEGKTIKLGANITLNEPNVKDWAAGKAAPTYKWTPIGTASKPFAGDFDGQGHSISGVYVKSKETVVGFFGKTAGGSSIKNFRLMDSYIEQSDTSGEWGVHTGSVVGIASGDIDKVYSNATVKSQKHYYVGGIAGGVEPASNTEGKLTISNCWFDGTLDMAEGVSYIGGIVSRQNNGKLYFENVLYTGHMKAYPTYTYPFVGGILASNALAEGLETHFESVVSAGTYDIEKGVNYICTVVSYLQNGFVNGNAVNPKYSFDNVFATRGWGNAASYGAEKSTSGDLTSTMTLTGKVVQTSNTDRLLGYDVQQNINGMDVAQKLDFSSAWTMRTNNIPVLTAFKDLVGARTLVADMSKTTLTNELGLNTIGKSISDAVAEGAGDYVVEVSGTKATYDAYLSQLSSLGFTAYANNAGTSMEADGIYAATYYKAEANNCGDWVVNVTFVEKEGSGSIYVSINSDVDLVPETLLNDDAANPLGEDTSESPISLSMVEDKAGVTITGNCFVFQLPNGHFIINDGNTNEGSGKILKAYLQELAGGADKPIYIDAWTLTHFHNDHGGALMDMINDASLRTNVYVDALYVNEASMYAQTTYTEGGSGYQHTQQILEGARRLQRSETDASSPVVYQVHMGQRYYFNGLTMDIVNTPEQMIGVEWDGGPSNSGNNANHIPDAFNTSSINFLFTIQDNNQKVLLGGDTTMVNMKYIMDVYGKNSSGYGTSQTLANINVFAAYHHGKNVMNTWGPSHTTVNGEKIEYDADGNNDWANYLLKNTNNPSGFKFDAMLFPNYKQYGTWIDKSYSVQHTYWSCNGIYKGDGDNAIVYPYDIGEMNKYYATNSKSHFTTGYQDSVITADDGSLRHGTVKIIFNAGGQISYSVFNSVHGQETYTFEETYAGTVE